MKARQFRTIITNKNGEISGLLQVENEENIKQEFDPLTVLGDLLNVVVYEEKSPYPQDNYSFKEGYTVHPFFLNSQYTSSACSKLADNLRIKPFFVAFDLLSEIIRENEQISISDFEVIKQFLNLRFTFQMLFEEINPLYEEGYTTNPFNGEEVEEYQYVPLDRIEGFNIKQLLENTDKSTHQFVYSCYSVEDIMFSVLHYLVFYKYKFAKCDHCGNYFATKTLKQKYCNRKSPYKSQYKIHTDKSRKGDYTHLHCEQAVRNIKQDLVRRQKWVYSHLQKSYEPDAADKFYNEYLTYKDAVDKCSSVENLHRLEHFLSIKTVKENWYEKHEKVKFPYTS